MFKWLNKLFKKNPRKKGRRIALAAMLAFRSERDAEKFNRIREELQNVIRSETLLTASMLHDFQLKLAEELKVNPLLFGVLFAELLSYVDPDEPEDEKDLFLFLQGIVDALNMVYPQRGWGFERP